MVNVGQVALELWVARPFSHHTGWIEGDDLYELGLTLADVNGMYGANSYCLRRKCWQSLNPTVSPYRATTCSSFAEAPNYALSTTKLIKIVPYLFYP